MHRTIWLASLLLTFGALWMANADPRTDLEPASVGDAVHARATATPPDKDGQQFVQIQIDVARDLYIYANPVGNLSLLPAQTTLEFKAARGLRGLKIDYPPGRVVRDIKFGDYAVYDGRIFIKALVRRLPGDRGPLEIDLNFQVCSRSSCTPGKIKLRIP